LTIGGEHKQRVDRQFATELGIPVHIVGPTDIPSLVGSLKQYQSKTLLYQNTPEMRRAVKLIAPALKTDTAQAFDDCIALDRNRLVFSPVYSVFNKRAKRAFKRPDDTLWTRVDIDRSKVKVLKGFPLAN